MLKLLQQIQKRLIVAIPIIMVAGLGAGLVWDPAPLKQLIVPLTFLMVYPMMVNLQLKKLVEGGDGKVQLATQLLNFTVIPLFAFLLGKLAFSTGCRPCGRCCHPKMELPGSQCPAF